MTMRTAFLVLGVVAAVSAAHAADDRQPYSGLESRQIKALAPERIDGLLNGLGLSYALAAELNGVPGPRHVLDLADALELDTGTTLKIEAIFTRMQESARRLGAELVATEARLEEAFASNRATPGEVDSLTAEIAALEGRLRAVHLTAHLETDPLLTRHQKHVYARERGYDGAAHSHGQHPTGQ